MEEKKRDIKAMLPSELARLYGVSVKTFRYWIKKINKDGELNRYGSTFYNPKQILYIFEKLGKPD